MEAIQLSLDERGRLTLPANIRKLLDWRPSDVIEVSLAEPAPDKVIVDSLIIVNLDRRDRMTDDEIKLVPNRVE
jgi:bifunctional DNA-binding transcriptional regulator/antitoxin component of YhaV-PrlF toxin-antitoxin module